MDDLSKYVETVRFLMSSTRKLSEAFQESDVRIRRELLTLLVMSKKLSIVL